jgi:hypothetical protein
LVVLIITTLNFEGELCLFRLEYLWWLD